MPRKITLFLASLFVTAHTHAQTQVGSNINGVLPDDRSGYTVDMPSSDMVAIAAPYKTGSIGEVKVMKWDGSSWTQKGSPLSGSVVDDFFGWSISMPDTNTLAVGAYRSDNNGAEAGHVQVFEWGGFDWLPKGSMIVGQSSSDLCGSAVSMPDANTIAISAPGNDNNGALSGNVRIFYWSGSNWVQKGNEIGGEALFDQSGNSVYMPDSNTVAIGARYNDGNGNNSGHVRIYNWDGTSWIQKGIDIDGEAMVDNSGYSISMPDSNTIAIGASDNDGNGTSSGHVRIYEWNGSNWNQKGIDIDGANADDLSGCSVSMPNNNTVAIGARYNDTNGSNAGHCRLFRWNGGSWVQLGTDINGEFGGDNCGNSVSMPNESTVAVGSFGSDANGNLSGQTRVFHICTNPISFISPTACNSYTSPSGNYTWTSGGFYSDTVTNAAGCDSIIGIDLTINTVDVSVNDFSPSFTANVSGATYQWLDCDNNYSAISGAVNQTFTATANGNYAVEITTNGCTDTSACFNVNTIGLGEGAMLLTPRLYPSPTKGEFTLDFGQVIPEAQIFFADIQGRLIQRYTLRNNQLAQFDLEVPAGIYFLTIQIVSEKRVLRVIIE